ncbi:MAG: methyltransferase domain-containing protein [Deltaproteobacteria bacterium]|nr:methyltransferase domain-containing protein [Deltaproteobacteria bacterium]
MQELNKISTAPISLTNQERIKLAFSRSARNYDSFALLQREMAAELLKKVVSLPSAPRLPHPIILDIGCGTGFLTYGLANAFPDANIFGCDISHAMTELAKDKGQGARDKKVYFFTADGGVLPYKDETFDMVVSNLTYQWIHDIKTAFSEAHWVLRPAGLFIFSTLGPKTLKELRYCYAEASARFNKDGLPPFMSFSEQKRIASALEKAGFSNISIEAADNIQTYPDMRSLLKTIKSIGAGNPFNMGGKSLARGSLLKRMAEVYEKRFKIQDSRFKTCNLQLATRNCVYATYEVMFVRAVKLG